ncbi:glycoside hydrolase family 88 protein [Galbibacter mesophilus]|uniref:glycoside hydrolase family 88 protein n=1 Tax=Galbibacter mesophilus TaxID=379069 RepID=UPI00191D3197|nr:glycoside hydrolase family 88 protein [Galbibacter mesophilus]MCM5661661.1 glycoside hydrolase family 88 protein [Galbibacter mesophilus]
MNKIGIFASILVFLTISCKQSKENTSEEPETTTLNTDSLLKIRYEKLLKFDVDSLKIPRSYSEEEGVRGVPSKDWTSGFFPGSLWKIYQLTEDARFEEKALEWTKFIEKEKFDSTTHDTGFKVFCSYGSALQSENNPLYEEIVVETANTLIGRYNKNVGAIKSWDWNVNVWQYPVIIDNMMNLELLFEATKFSGDSTYYNVANNHANTTLKNHFRKDNSSYHVVVYDTINGSVREKVTHQGFNDESAWARGQAWGIYGFTMTYRYTKDKNHLEQAEAIAQFYLEHENLPEDGIPYWDFNDPGIPDSPRDVSAATIVASAFLELYEYTKNDKYKNYSQKVLKALKTSEYLLGPEVEAPFILKHSTGNWPGKDEVDVAINYADYYFLETMLRNRALKE